MKCLHIAHPRPIVGVGSSVTLWGFVFTAQDNGDLVADIQDVFIADMEKANRVRRMHEQEPQAPPQAPESDKPLAEMTVLELRAEAKRRGISLPNGDPKEKIIARLEGRDEPAEQSRLAE